MTDAQAVSAGRRLASSGRGGQVRRAARLSLADMVAAMAAAGVTVTRTTVDRWDRGVGMPRRDAAVVYLRVITELEAGLPPGWDETPDADDRRDDGV
jgi:hypothetical protein